MWLKQIVLEVGRERIATAPWQVLISCNSNLFELFVQHVHSKQADTSKLPQEPMPTKAVFIIRTTQEFWGKITSLFQTVAWKKPVGLLCVSTGQPQKNKTSLDLDCQCLAFLITPVPKLYFPCTTTSSHANMGRWAVFLATFCLPFPLKNVGRPGTSTSRKTVLQLSV